MRLDSAAATGLGKQAGGLVPRVTRVALHPGLFSLRPSGTHYIGEPKLVGCARGDTALVGELSIDLSHSSHRDEWGAVDLWRGSRWLGRC